MSMKDNTAILSGIRVVEMSVWMSGAVTGVMLADLGAEVIKVEPPGGFPGRAPLKVNGASTTKIINDQEVNAAYEAIEHNKKNMTLDLTSERGREALYKLIGKSDVFIHNLNPHQVEELNIDYPTLSPCNPRLVYGVITGYGQDGPDRVVPAEDLTSMARSGLMYAAHAGKDPTYLVGMLSETINGNLLAHGILAALIKREDTGEGQEVSVSQLAASMWLHQSRININLLNGQEFQEYIRSEAANPLLNWYKCQDDKWISLSSHQADKYWSDHCEILGIKNLEHDPKFENIDVRAENAPELIAIMDKIFATKMREEWLQIHKQAKSGLAVTPLNSVPELSADPQNLANNYIISFKHPIAGEMLTIGNPVEYTKTPVSERKSAPQLGEHTEEVLTELCGYSPEEIATMASEGII